LPVLRDDHRDGLADRFFGSIAEDALRTPIPTRDYAVEVLAYDCVVAGLDDGCQPTQSLFAFAKRCFGPLALGNVDTCRV